MLKAIVYLAVVFGAAVSTVHAHKRILKHAGGRIPGPPKWMLVDESGGDLRIGGVQNTFPAPPTKAALRIDTITNGGAGIGGIQSLVPAGSSLYWTVGARLNVLDADALGGQGIHVASSMPWSATESRHFGLLFGVSDDGDPIVGLEGHPFSMEIDDGAGKYHAISLHVDMLGAKPFSVLKVDLQQIYKGDYLGYGGPLVDSDDPWLSWGDLNPSADVNGSAYWYSVKMNTGTPEPASALLLMFGFAGLLELRFRRHAQNRP